MSAGWDRRRDGGLSPFSRSLRADDVPDDGLDLRLSAGSDERAAIAEQVGVPSIEAFDAAFHIDRQPGGGLLVRGEVKAAVTQTCVVSLEPFESEIAQPVEISFAPAKTTHAGDAARGERAGASRRHRVDVPDSPAPAEPDEDDPPDPIVDGRIDLGAVAVEFLTLGLDPYPKKPGVRFSEIAVDETGSPKSSPFAALERLRDRS